MRLPNCVVWRVQRDAQRDGQALLRQLPDAGHDAACADRYGSEADVQTVRMVDQPQEADDRVIVIQRFAAAHEHDVAHLARDAPGYRLARSTCASISPADRLRTHPPSVLAQKAQPILHPTCVEMHRL